MGEELLRDALAGEDTQEARAGRMLICEFGLSIVALSRNFAEFLRWVTRSPGR